MAPFSIPAPCIIPLRLPIFGGPKSIDSDTKIQLLCETQIQHEIYYTLDGTKPQPYAGIVQGNKTIKYNSPFCLPVGKQTIKAMAINPNIHTMCSSIITKCYEVLKGDTENIIHSSNNMKQSKKVKKTRKKSSKEELYCNNKEAEEQVDHKFNSFSVIGNGTNPLEDAFIGGSDFETVHSDSEDSVEDQNDLPSAVFDDGIDSNDDSNEEFDNSQFSDIADKTIDAKIHENNCVSEKLLEEKDVVENNFIVSNRTANNNETQFCCVKCDMTLQHCSSCNQMNAVSSKFCIQCGKKLAKVCLFCKEFNPSIASFCQYCGKKLSSDIQVETSVKVDHSVMAKPKFKDMSIQRVPALMDKESQTVPDRSPVKKSVPRFPMKPIPRHSPGRGYWHQQLDYICNHLKSHAYNHLEFRKEISEPTLCDFKSAQITKDENNVTVTIVFSPLVTEKNGPSDDIKPED